MNLLAHAYLSGTSEKILIGNFMADFIHGNQFQHYEPEIIRGIYLHRYIDTYTDAHPTVRQSIRRLQPDFAKFSGIVVDIFYDYFLVNHFLNIAQKPLSPFVAWVYQTLESHREILPGSLQKILPKMIAQNWLEEYGNLEGVRQSLSGISRRSKYAPALDRAVVNLEREHEDFEQDFQRFFPDLQKYVAEQLDKPENE